MAAKDRLVAGEPPLLGPPPPMYWRCLGWSPGLPEGDCRVFPRLPPRAREGEGVRRERMGEPMAMRICGAMEGGDGERDSLKEERRLSGLEGGGASPAGW